MCNQNCNQGRGCDCRPPLPEGYLEEPEDSHELTLDEKIVLVCIAVLSTVGGVSILRAVFAFFSEQV